MHSVGVTRLGVGTEMTSRVRAGCDGVKVTGGATVRREMDRRRCEMRFSGQGFGTIGYGKGKPG